ncbi:hypothetical protein ABT357_24940 [Streptomyces albidoflavus]|uniref:hypothetical protein n=1 Tax=Streptomyces albidoflavus TaxID=1886 RepID=UPI00332FB7A2
MNLFKVTVTPEQQAAMRGSLVQAFAPLRKSIPTPEQQAALQVSMASAFKPLMFALLAQQERAEAGRRDSSRA